MEEFYWITELEHASVCEYVLPPCQWLSVFWHGVVVEPQGLQNNWSFQEASSEHGRVKEL